MSNINGESEITYKQYNWITGKEHQAEKEGLAKAEAIIASGEVKQQFHDRLVSFMAPWSTNELTAFANGELSEIYIKPVLSYFWDLDYPKAPVLTTAEVKAEDLEPLHDAINQKLQTVFEASVWSGLLGWARPKAKAVANHLLDEAKLVTKPIQVRARKNDVWASLASVQKQAIGSTPITKADQKWLSQVYATAYSAGQKEVTEQVITSDSFSDAVIAFISEWDTSTLQSLASNSDSKVVSETVGSLTQILYDDFFGTVPPIPIGDAPVGISQSNRDYFVSLSCEEGVKDKLADELFDEVPLYAKSAL